jgi:hypothetical protein|tara:strand:- start:1572 stop:1718 length:147 start_codon:yes stop_codon:yes gene_type:complete
VFSRFAFYPHKKKNHASVPIIIHLYRAQMRLVCGQETPNEEAKNFYNG